MRYLLAITFVVLVLLGAYYFYQVNRKVPGKKSIDMASTIFKYPNSKSWSVDSSSQFCLILDADHCRTPAKINFEAGEDWVTVYNYYKSQMIYLGWKTNSIIITSVPSSVVFTNDLNCNAELSPSGKSLYTFDVYCPEN